MAMFDSGDWCCEPDSGDCCGPGSWCCSRAGKHDHCEECGDRASWGASDLPEHAVATFCEGCGGLLSVEYE